MHKWSIKLLPYVIFTHKAIPVLTAFIHNKHFTWNDIRTSIKICFKHFAFSAFTNVFKTAAAARRKTTHIRKTEGRANFPGCGHFSQRVYNNLRYNTHRSADSLGKQSRTLRWEEDSKLVKRMF